MAENNKTSWELSAYMDGELGKAEADRVARALRSDPALQRELDTLRATREMLLSLPRYRAGKGLADRIVAAAEQLQAHSPTDAGVSGKADRWSRRLAAAAVLLIAAGAGMMVTRAWLEQDDRPVGPSIARTDAPEDRPSGVGGGVDPSPPGPARRSDEVHNDGCVDRKDIFTDDLDQARRDVERALLTNGLVPEARAKSVRIGKGRMSRAGGGNFRFNQVSTETVSYDVVGTAEQIAGVHAELGRIQKRQFVAQAPRPVLDRPGGKLLAKKYEKAKPETGGRIESKGGATPGPGAAARAPVVCPKAPARTRDDKQAVMRIDLARAEGLAMKEWDRLLDMVWGGQASQKSSVLAAKQAEGATTTAADARGRRKHVAGTLEDATAGQSQEALAGRQKSDGQRLVTGNVRQLTITLNKSPLTHADAARRAAMERAAKSARE